MDGIANEVRRRRRATEMTQAQLGDAVDISRQAINVVERGGTPSLRTAMALARVLGADVEAVFPDHARRADEWLKGPKK